MQKFTLRTLKLVVLFSFFCGSLAGAETFLPTTQNYNYNFNILNNLSTPPTAQNFNIKNFSLFSTLKKSLPFRREFFGNPPPYLAAQVTSISMGYFHACAIVGGRLYCWGLNSSGQLGINSTDTTTTPTLTYDPSTTSFTGLLGGQGVSSVSANGYNTCAINADGKLYCWGENDSGQVGNGTLGFDCKYPVLIEDPSTLSCSGLLGSETVIAVSVGASPNDTPEGESSGRTHVCAINADDKLYCWGDNTFGQLGDGQSGGSLPRLVGDSGTLNGRGVVQVSAGYSFTCAINTESLLFCWGKNDYGQLGIYSTENTTSPTPIYNADPEKVGGLGTGNDPAVMSVSAGTTHTCAIESGYLFCWGDGSYGALGNGDGTDRSFPVAINKGSPPGQLDGSIVLSTSSGSGFTCAINEIGEIYCWGKNTDKKLLGISGVDTRFPQLVAGSDSNPNPGLLGTYTVNAVSCSNSGPSYQSICGINSQHNLYCWGDSNFGQLGQNSTTTNTTPTQTLFNEDSTCNGIDDDGDGLTDEDYVSVSCNTGLHGLCAAGTTSCNAGSVVCNQTNSPTTEIACNNIDDDCDGITDTDAAGYGAACNNGLLGACYKTGTMSVCDGGVLTCSAPNVEPTTEVACNNIDDDCDGVTDTDAAGYGAACNNGLLGACYKTGTMSVCDGGVLTCSAPNVEPTTEVACNNIDDDCDGVTDTDAAGYGAACNNGLLGACYKTGTMSVCDGGVLTCSAPNVEPTTEVACNNIDDDCDGVTDTDAAGYGAACNNGLLGACYKTGTMTLCEGGVLTCSAPDADPVSEICGNGIDDDCDGETDEDCNAETPTPTPPAPFVDACPTDPNKTEAGVCGCGIADSDHNNNGIIDCLDPKWPTTKIDSIVTPNTKPVTPRVDVVKKKVVVYMQRFKRAELLKKLRNVVNYAKKNKRKKITFRYEVVLRQVSTKTTYKSITKKKIQSRISKRNKVIFKKQRQGTYKIKYRVKIYKNGKLAKNTKWSDSKTVTVSKK
jgi:alpha-tubulin suppressor-like RCC1 family protein